MSKPAEPKLVTVALNCSVKVSGTLYAPDDVIEVSEDIARRLIEQKAADPWKPEAEAAPEVEVKEAKKPEGNEPPDPDGKDSKPKGGKDSEPAPDGEKEAAA
jgi:hypothetical protein